MMQTNRSVVRDAMTARLLVEDAEIGVDEFLSSVDNYLAAGSSGQTLKKDTVDS